MITWSEWIVVASIALGAVSVPFSAWIIYSVCKRYLGKGNKDAN